MTYAWCATKPPIGAEVRRMPCKRPGCACDVAYREPMEGGRVERLEEGGSELRIHVRWGERQPVMVYFQRHLRWKREVADEP